METIETTDRAIKVVVNGQPRDLVIGKDSGSTSIEVAGEQKKFNFDYEYLKDENGHRVLVEEIIAFMLSNGYRQELPSKEEMEQLKKENEGIKGKVAEPRSIARILLSGIKDYNYQDARAELIDSVLNTEEAKTDKAVNDLVGMAITGTDAIAKLVIAGFTSPGANKVIATAALDKISKHAKASEFVKGLALEALAGLTE